MSATRPPSKYIVKRFVPIAAVVLLLTLNGCSRPQDPTPVTTVGTGATAQQPAAAAAQQPAAATPSPRPGGVANVGMLPEPSPPPQVYMVQPGDTLDAIAARFGFDLQSLMSANGIDDPTLVQVGQELRIPSPQIETGPSIRVLPDSEFVNGPAYASFDVDSFVADYGGYLADYSEYVGTELLSGAEIVQLVAHHYSVGPRLLLALIELKGDWVTQADPGWPALGYNSSGVDSFSGQLAWAADELNRGYYDWRGRGMRLITWPDGNATRYASGLNAATAGLQYFFSINSLKDEWEMLSGEGPGSLLATYRALFGDPAQYAVEPLIPGNLDNPSWVLPWPKGESWHYTGGPHGAWEDGSAWAALDFVPPGGPFGCGVPESSATAAASGRVVYSQNGEVMIDLDGDGHEQTGWVLFYLHMAADGRVPVGTQVKPGDPIGRPSCEGGFSESAHLHIARKYNGEWIAADGPLPFTLSGWQPRSAGAQYDGSLNRDGRSIDSAETWDLQVNGIRADR